MAMELATKDGLQYGWSVFGKFYVGNSEQLKSVGVVDIKGN
jgi:hypothetical protein